MTIAALAIAVSVLMHVAWNLLARHADLRSNFLWWGVSGHLLLLGPYSLYSLARDAQWTPTLVAAILITGWENIAMLGAIVLIRIVLSYFLEREMERTHQSALSGRLSDPDGDDPDER